MRRPLQGREWQPRRVWLYRAVVRLLHWLVPLGIITSALVVLGRILSRQSAETIINQVLTVDNERLLMAGAICGFNYLVLTQYELLSVRFLGYSTPFRRIGVVAFISYAFSQTIGFALLVGAAVRFRFYSPTISIQDIARIILFSGFHFWIAMALLSGISMCLEPTVISASLPLSRAGVQGVGLMLTLPSVLYILATYFYPTGTLFGRSFELPSTRVGLYALAVACVDWLLVALLLYTLLPSHDKIPFLWLLSSYLGGQLLAIASHMPGGIGVLESVLVSALSGEVTEAEVLSSVVLYRTIYTLVPFVIACVLLLVIELGGWIVRQWGGVRAGGRSSQ